ncbi:glycosyltransferase [Oerskovia sp. USHLN155]|uniref:glycosyltransferase n=1 Tax=Oerskovia sp. USHLN155 TaxID=3081288 RepID=UPI00301A7BC5
MKIAMISEHASPLATLGSVDAGGQNVHVASLAERLAHQGHTVSVYTRRDDAALPPVVTVAPGLEVVHVDAGPATRLPKDDLLPHMRAFGNELFAAWSRPGAAPDIVHAHFWMSGLAGLSSTGRLDIPLVQTFHALGSVKRRHQGDDDTSPPQRIDLERLLCAEVDLVIATCSDEVTELTALGAAADRIDVVPCGVDIGRFRPDLRRGRRAAHRGDRLHALSVGRLVERKGIETVIRSLVDAVDVDLVVIGGPPAAELGGDPEARRLRDLADALGVGQRVELVGGIDQQGVRDAMHAADVVVCDPWYEPFGIVPIEAAACGRPVIGSAVGGLLDSVVHERTGLLVPPRDPAALAAAFKRLHSDRRLGESLGSAGRIRAERLYGWSTVARRTAHAYENVIDARSGRDRSDARGGPGHVLDGVGSPTGTTRTRPSTREPIGPRTTGEDR